MATKILINGKEVTNPYVKAFLVIGAIITMALVTTVVIFVLLPIIGVAVTLSAGFVVIFIVAIFLGIATLAFVTAMLGMLFGAMEFRIEKSRKRHEHPPNM